MTTALSPGQPTRVRYGVVAFSVGMALILYLDRMAIGVALPAIADDLGLSLTEVGDSVAAFFWSYALMQVPAGWLGDRWGGRRALTLYVVAWSVAMIGLGMAGGLISLIVMRGLLGVGQAGAYATTAGFLRRWIPLQRRGLANSAVTLGGRAGGVLAPALTPVLMGAAALWLGTVDRWRPVFIAYALIGFVWAVAFWFWFRDTPAEHPGVNDAERDLIGDVEPPVESRATSGEPRARMSLGVLLGNRSLRRLSVVNFFINVGWIFLATWLPTYLMKVHGVSEQQAGFYTSLTAASGMAGCLSGGFATDWLMARFGLVWGRRIPSVISYSGASIGLGACWLLDDTGAIVTVLVVASFFGDFALGALWATYQDIGGPWSGTVLGWANMCGNIGAACAISVIGRLVDGYGWPATFVMAGGAYAIGAVTWLGVDPRERIDL